MNGNFILDLMCYKVLLILMSLNNVFCTKLIFHIIKLHSSVESAFPYYILRESQTTQNALWLRASVCLSVCLCVSLSAAACSHYCTDPDVTWGSGRG